MSSPIQSLGKVFTVERRAAGSWNTVTGVFDKGALSTLTPTLVIQPMKPNEVLLLPEHRRQMESVKVYSVTELLTTDEKAQTTTDVLIYRGLRWEILQIGHWNEAPFLKHFKYAAVKIDGEGG